MSRMENMQPAYIRTTIKNVLLNKPAKIDNLMRSVFIKLMPNIVPTKSEKALVLTMIQELAFNGQININNGTISLNLQYRVSSVEEDYRLNSLQNVTRKPMKISGNIYCVSVGSERYPSLWRELELDSHIEVELVPEPTNKKDPLAVALCINDRPYAYMLRSEAALYHPLIVKLRAQGYKASIDAKVAVDEKLSTFKVFTFYLPTLQELSEQIESI